MGKHGIRVCVRTRPTVTFAQERILLDKDSNAITVHNPSSGGDVLKNRKESWTFKFHNVLHNASQDTVYETVAKDIVRGVMQGVNGTIMAYGQTGAGKTFTMIGGTANYKHRGVSPRAISQIFSEIDARPDIEFQVRASYMEIYNERIYDLLLPDPLATSSGAGEGSAPDYQIVEDREGTRGTYVRGLTMLDVGSEEEALDALFRGEMARTTAEHMLNKQSNRSHCIFTLHVEQRSRLSSGERVVSSKLHLVDLAGSERLKKTLAAPAGGSVDDTTRRESMYINKSLAYLEQCVVALTGRHVAHVPYRQTKLTNVLKDSLGGNCKTLLIACIWGEERHLEETVSTLKLAARMMRVQNSAETNVEMDPLLLVKKYERRIKELKAELMMHDALAERGGVSYDEFTDEQRNEIARMVQEYVDAPPEKEEEVLRLDTVQQIREVCRQFKALMRRSEAATEERLRARFSVTAKQDAPSARLASRSGDIGGGKDEEEEEGGEEKEVGELVEGGGYHFGRAPSRARPPGGIDKGPASPTGKRSAAAVGGYGEAGGGGGGAEGDSSDEAGVADVRSMTRDEAFEHFKQTAGAELNDELLRAKQRSRQLKEEARRLASAANDVKRSIAELKAALGAKQRERHTPGGAMGGLAEEEVVDEEEFRLMKEAHDAKRQYRTAVTRLSDVRPRLDGAQADVARARKALLDAFAHWFSEHGGALDADDLPPGTRALGDGEEGDKLDYSEQFDQMEMQRVVEADPDSLAFFSAHKKMRQTLTRGGLTQKARLLKTKRGSS